MPSDQPQRKALTFFPERLKSQESFTKSDFEKATGWSGSTLSTYWSKQFKPFVIPIGNNRYRVSEGFRPYANWRKFQRPTATDATRNQKGRNNRPRLVKVRPPETDLLRIGHCSCFSPTPHLEVRKHEYAAGERNPRHHQIPLWRSTSTADRAARVPQTTVQPPNPRNRLIA